MQLEYRCPAVNRRAAEERVENQRLAVLHYSTHCQTREQTISLREEGPKIRKLDTVNLRTTHAPVPISVHPRVLSQRDREPDSSIQGDLRHCRSPRGRSVTHPGNFMLLTVDPNPHPLLACLPANNCAIEHRLNDESISPLRILPTIDRPSARPVL